MAKITFRDVIERTIEKVGKPLSAQEIWDKANELKLTEDFYTKGDTPVATISSNFTNEFLKNGDNSKFVKIGDNPRRFFLKRLMDDNYIETEQKQKDNAKEIINSFTETKRFSERDLHPLLVAFGHSQFKANLKTIYHELSVKPEKGQNEWLHPDLVGVYFPFKYYEDVTLKIQQSLSLTSIKLFSFELKISLNFRNLRQSYFQAVSNSSWANEGYLVTLNIIEDPIFIEEIRRLNNAFGIGIIKLNSDNILNSEIIFPSKINREIDWDTVNRLAKDNSDFNNFLDLITEDCELRKVKSQYDKVLNTEELAKYITDNGIGNIK